MSARTALVLLVLLAMLGGGALLYRQQERTQRPEAADTLGRQLLPELKAAEVAAIRIAEPQRTLTVRLKDGRWTLAERADFPADVARVRAFVLQALSLKAGQSEPLGEKDRARLELHGEGATRVAFSSAEDKTLGELLVGRKYFRREVDDPKTARADGRFVLLPAQPERVYLVADPLTQASAASADWIDRTSFQVEKVKTLEVRYPDGGGWRIERDGDNADWRLAGARPGEKVDVARANSASYSLSLLELADVAPPGAKQTGLEQPTVIEATTLEGLAYVIRVGRLEGENYFVTFSATGALRPIDKDAERLKKVEERLAHEKLLAQHVLLVPRSKLEDTLKKRAELLEAKDTKK
ncbi:MAG TPA: DUF4340 domain-containing protein [Burkholderiales bacterium]|nr:DUF4340 domain-containing protein [Burkholderiales bacterium]